MMYRVNMIYSISRNSAFPEVGGKDPMPKPLFTEYAIVFSVVYITLATTFFYTV